MNKSRKSFKLIVFVSILALVLAISASSIVAKTNTKPKKAKVTIKNSVYHPKTIKKKGPAKVTWRNKDAISHTVTADDGSFDSGQLSNGQTFSTTLAKGTYKYHCENHPDMKGKVVVR